MKRYDMDNESLKKILNDWKERKHFNDNYNSYLKKYKSYENVESYPFTIDDVHKKFTDEQLLDSIDLEKIDLYLRNKKLSKITQKIKNK